MEKNIITEKEYQEILKMKPEDRCRKSGNTINDRISGILIAYSRRYDMRGGWNDLITLRDAEKEIRQLICDCGGDLNAL